MCGLEGTLDALARMRGVSMAAVVDADSGVCLACRDCSGAAADGGDAARARRQVERAARYVAATAAARRNAASGRLPVESVLSLRRQCHVARSVPGVDGGSLLVYLAFDRGALDLARARRGVEEAASAVRLSPEERRALRAARQHAAGLPCGG